MKKGNLDNNENSNIIKLEEEIDNLKSKISDQKMKMIKQLINMKIK